MISILDGYSARERTMEGLIQMLDEKDRDRIVAEIQARFEERMIPRD